MLAHLFLPRGRSRSLNYSSLLEVISRLPVQPLFEREDCTIDQKAPNNCLRAAVARPTALAGLGALESAGSMDCYWANRNSVDVPRDSSRIRVSNSKFEPVAWPLASTTLVSELLFPPTAVILGNFFDLNRE